MSLCGVRTLIDLRDKVVMKLEGGQEAGVRILNLLSS